jgi:chromosome segregation ATPase
VVPARRLYIPIMSFSRTQTVLALLLVGSILATPAALARQMYRYINAEGNKVVGYQVPPEFVANGYEILSETGALVAVVPRQLNEGEREDMDEQARRERDAAEEKERLRKWDESLLLRYSTLDDIEAARERALRDLRIRVSILKGKLRSLKQQVENYQAMAADQERLGNTVDVEHLKAIDDLQSEIASTERAVRDRQEEIASVDADYDRDVDRFSQLLDIVELRKAMASGG